VVHLRTQSLGAVRSRLPQSTPASAWCDPGFSLSWRHLEKEYPPPGSERTDFRFLGSWPETSEEITDDVLNRAKNSFRMARSRSTERAQTTSSTRSRTSESWQEGAEEVGRAKSRTLPSATTTTTRCGRASYLW